MSHLNNNNQRFNKDHHGVGHGRSHGGGYRDHGRDHGVGHRDHGRDNHGRDNHGRDSYSKPRFKSFRTDFTTEQDKKIMDENYTVNCDNLIEEDDIYCSEEVSKLKCESFEDMNLDELLMRGIINFGFEFPSKIQSYAIPAITAGHDIIAQAQSGSGKTGAFMISLLQKIKSQKKGSQKKGPRAIVLSNTVDLAWQTFLVGTAIAEFMKDVKFALTVGGTDIERNISEIRNAQGVIGTPGRVLHIMKDHIYLFADVEVVIIDECDEMLLGNLSEDVQAILTLLEEQEYQLCLFSATLTNKTMDAANCILVDPVKILIKKEKITLDGIKQKYIKVDSENQKIGVIMDMLQACPIEKFIVYVNSIRNLDRIKQSLEAQEIKVLAINSQMQKPERAQVLREFKQGDVKCLISTDLLSRGIDIQQLSLVVNYELPRPDKISNYIHRIGRTGRYGKEGWAINIVTSQEISTINSITATFRCRIEPLTSDEISTISI